MVKEPPVMVVNKTTRKTARQKRSTAGTPRCPSGGNRRGKGRRKKRIVRKWKVPMWLYYILMGGAAALLILLFLYPSLCLSLEALLWNKGIWRLSSGWV